MLVSFTLYKYALYKNKNRRIQFELFKQNDINSMSTSPPTNTSPDSSDSSDSSDYIDPIDFIAFLIVFSVEFIMLFYAISMALRFTKNKSTSETVIHLLLAMFLPWVYVLINATLQTPIYLSLYPSE